MVWAAATAVGLAGGCFDVHEDPCGNACDRVEASGPAIILTQNSALIGAIETTVSEWDYDAGQEGVCEVRWLASTYADGYPSEPVCPPGTLDAAARSIPCPTRFDCPSYRVFSYGGCDKAWINMTVDACFVGIISVTGERQDIPMVKKSPEPIRSQCYDGCSHTWHELVAYSAIPTSVTLTFSQTDGGSAIDASSGE